MSQPLFHLPFNRESEGTIKLLTYGVIAKMRQIAVRMASSLQIGQILVGRTGIPYHLQKVLYERKEKNVKNEEVIRRLWLALYEPSTPIGIS